MKNTKENIIFALQNGLSLEDVNEYLKKDKDIVFAAIMKDSFALQYTDNQLKKDKDFILEVVKKSPFTLKYVDDSLKADKDVVLAAMEKSTSVYKFASESLKKDKDILSLLLVLDTSGSNSPIPELRTVKMLKMIEKGMVLKVITTDPGMRTDIPFLVKNRGNILLEKKESENGSRCEFLIKKEEDSN